ncbi:MAG: type Z 30S ribosomal protein S14 [Elusimicrobia bacterium]|nr:type Z 30S ribosomal protein S14 [Elusimicrobiota bacterium]
MATSAWMAKLRKPPKYAVRHRNRCQICGRPRGYYRDFGLCRICLRNMSHQGLIPGMRKSSW